MAFVHANNTRRVVFRSAPTYDQLIRKVEELFPRFASEAFMLKHGNMVIDAEAWEILRSKLSLEFAVNVSHAGRVEDLGKVEGQRRAGLKMAWHVWRGWQGKQTRAESGGQGKGVVEQGMLRVEGVGYIDARGGEREATPAGCTHDFFNALNTTEWIPLSLHSSSSHCLDPVRQLLSSLVGLDGKCVAFGLVVSAHHPLVVQCISRHVPPCCCRW
jgi:hypothetical protein